MTNTRYSTTGEVTIAVRKHTGLNSGEARMSTKFVDGFDNYLTTITPMPGTSATLEDIAQAVQGWDGEIEVAAKSVRLKTRHVREVEVAEVDDCKLTTVPGLSELESEPVVDDVAHLDEVEVDERQEDAVEASAAIAPESTRGRTNAINTVVHPLNAGVSGGRRIDGASVHTLNVVADTADEVVAAVLQLGWAGVGVEVTDEPATTYRDGQPVEAVKVRVRVPDVDEDGVPARRFDVVDAAPVEEPVAELPKLDEPLRVEVAEGYKIRTGSTNGVWWIELFRETGEVEDEIHLDTKRNIPAADVQDVVNEMIRIAEEIELAQLQDEIDLYREQQKADESPAEVEEVVHPAQAADQDEDEDLDEIEVDDEEWAAREAADAKISNADRDPVFGLPMEPDYVPDPRQNLPVIGVDEEIAVEDMVAGQAIERRVSVRGSMVRVLAPCCGRQLPLPVTAGMYAPVACGWACKMMFLVTRLWTDERHEDSVARFVVVGPTLVVSQYYPGRGKKAA